MRQIVVHMQTTLNNRIANADGSFWEPFPWGEDEMRYHRPPPRRNEGVRRGAVVLRYQVGGGPPDAGTQAGA